MRLAYLVADAGIPFHGSKGASVHVRSITTALARLGHDVVCYVARAGEKCQAADPVEVKQVSLGSLSQRLLDGIEPETGRRKSPSPRRREVAGLLLGTEMEQLVAEDHVRAPYDALVERYSLWSLAGSRLASRLHIPLVLEVNAPLPEEQRRFRSLGMEDVAVAIRSAVFAGAEAISVVSSALVRHAVEAGAEAARVHVIPNGHDPALFDHSQLRREVPQALTIGFLGSLKPWHGLKILCQAFAELASRRPDAHLVMVGDGPMRTWVESFAQAQGLAGRIRITGGCDQKTAARLVGTFDIAVAPYSEGEDCYFSPLKIFEYMGAGRAIVASRVGQVAEVLEHKRTAWLVEAGNVVALAEALGHLADDATLRRSLGTAAAELAGRKYRWEDAARHVVRLAENMLIQEECSHV